jgi:rhodanese-related sulfurtransferase
VREKNEWQQERIPGVIHIPLSQLNGRLAELEAYKDTLIIVQCRSGRRSKQALTALKSAGFTELYNLEGGN